MIAISIAAYDMDGIEFNQETGACSRSGAADVSMRGGGTLQYNTLKAYRRLCDLYGWPQSFEGLRMFAWQVKMGYRSIWLGEDDGRNRV